MHYSKALFLIILVLFETSWAGKCFLENSLSDPALKNNTEFWIEITKLRETGKYNDFHIQELIAKHGGSRTESTSVKVANASVKTVPIEIHKKAQKEIARLPKHLKKHFDEFMELATTPEGLKNLQQNRNKWNYEKLAQFGDHAHSVRLNDGYRVLFDKTDTGIAVRAVNKGDIHGN